MDLSKLKLPRGLRLDANDALMITSGGYPCREILYVNAAFARLTGFTASEWIGRSGDLLLADGPLQMESLLWLEAAEDGREVHWIARLHRRDGTPFCAEAHLHPMKGADGRIEHVAVVLTDVTSRVGQGRSRDRSVAPPATFEVRKTA
jgi:PAS domain S-box-containing protein